MSANGSQQDDSLSAPGAKDDAIVVTMQLYIPLIIAGFLLFEYGRQKHKNTYNPKNGDLQRRHRLVEEEPNIPWFSWIKVVLGVSDDDIMKFGGLDGLVVIRFQQLGFKISLCACVCGLVLAPLYAHSNPKELTGNTITQCTIGNLSNKDSFIWLSTVAMYIISLYTMYLLRVEYVTFNQRRQEYLSKLEPAQYSVIIDDIPEELQSQPLLEEYMKYLFKDELHSVAIVCELAPIEKLVSERDALLPKMENAVAVYQQKEERVKHRVGGCCCCGGTKVDSMSTYETQINEMNEEITNMIQDFIRRNLEADQLIKSSMATSVSSSKLSKSKSKVDGSYRRIEGDEEIPSTNPSSSYIDKSLIRPSAFISFKSLKAVMVARQLLQSAKAAEMIVRSAPTPTDVQWSNVGYTHDKREIGKLFALAATSALIIFWAIPVSFVAALSNVDEMRKKWAFLDNLLNNNTWLTNLLKQLSPLLINALMSFVPMILRLFVLWEFHASISGSEVSVYMKYSIFIIVQVFLMVSIAGTASGALADITDNPTKTPTLLAKSIPEQSIFFVIMLMQQVVGYLLEILRVVPIIFGWIYDKFAPKYTDRQRNSKWIIFDAITRPGPFSIVELFSNHALHLVLILCYAVIAPVISLVGIIYFGVTTVVIRRQILYVYDFVDNGGLYWPKAYGFVITGLLLGQITIIGVVSLKEAAIQGSLLLALFILTIVFHIYIQRTYTVPSNFLALNECNRIDREREDVDFTFLDEIYRQDALKAHEIELHFVPPLEDDLDV